MRATKLHDGWILAIGYPNPGYPRPQLKKFDPVPAQVPGCVHLDLMRAGIIPDPFVDRFELGVQWVDEADWTYRTTFEFQGTGSRQVLRFDCLDTVATVLLNGEEVATSDNFFIPLEVEVTGKLRPGANDLEIRFLSAVKTGEARRREWFGLHGLANETEMFDERAFIRKPGYMFGWDWGPRLVGCGIQGEVTLLEFEERIASFDVTVSPAADGWFEVRAAADVASAAYEFISGNAVTEIVPDGPGAWRVRGPLWWPAGMGDQPLHEVRASIPGQTVTKRIGLRTVELRQEPDAHGSTFEFIVNGQPFWARGANWIPEDSFPCRIDPGQTQQRLRRYRDLNFNMIRVWGGGLYESEAFYDACDELGILVWQDFPFACMYFPDDEPWQTVVQREAEHQVRRLRHRASIALWCGNNENHAMWQQQWGSPGIVPSRYCGEHLYDLVLPNVLAALDPGRPYVASSPIGVSPDDSIPIGPGRNVGIDGWGDSHYWDVWHGRGDWVHYVESRARFSSEFGFASSCSMEQWRACLSSEALGETFPGPTALHHEKTGKKWETFYGFITLHYPECRTLEDWVYYSRLNQRDALRHGIEHYRRSDFCRGSLIWQANDCWPVMSWAVEDYLGVLKPAGYELRRLYADVMVSLAFRTGGIDVWVCNDGVSAFEGVLEIEVVDTHTGPISRDEVLVSLSSNSRAAVSEFDGSRYHSTRTAVRFSLGGVDRWTFLCEPKDLDLPEPVFEYTNDGWRVVNFIAEYIPGEGDQKPVTGWGIHLPGGDPRDGRFLLS